MYLPFLLLSAPASLLKNSYSEEVKEKSGAEVEEYACEVENALSELYISVVE